MRSETAVVATLLLVGCHRGELGMRTADDAPERYYPGWVAAVPMHVDAVRTCTAERPPPTLVLDVSARPSGAIGVTSVDGMGVVERCAVHEGRVVHRSRSSVGPEQLSQAGLPVFVLGLEPPVVGTNVLLEEVRNDEEELIGWLYWPAEDVRSEGVEHHATGDE